jgi:hypothetical protein
MFVALIAALWAAEPSAGARSPEVTTGEPGSPEIVCENGQTYLRLTFDRPLDAAQYSGWIGNDVGADLITWKRMSPNTLETRVASSYLQSFQLGYVVDGLDVSGTMGLEDAKKEVVTCNACEGGVNPP